MLIRNLGYFGIHIVDSNKHAPGVKVIPKTGSHVTQLTGLDLKDLKNDFRWSVKNRPLSHGIAPKGDIMVPVKEAAMHS